MNPLKPIGAGIIATEAESRLQVFVVATLAEAVKLNVLLFLFNVLFPMYPMDGAKIIIGLLLLCNVPARAAACVLLALSVPLSVFCVAFGP